LNINTIKEAFDYITNKYQKGYTTSDEFNLLFNLYQTNYYSFLLGHIEQYQYGRSVPRVGGNMTEDIETKLSPFIKTNDALAVTLGKATKPTDFTKLIAMRTSDDKPCFRVKHDRKGSRLKSVILTASEDPYYVDYNTYWEVAGTTVKIDYYPDKPDDVTWGYTDSAGREIYDSNTSTDPLWHDTEIVPILGRMLKATGIVLDDGQILQYAQSVINTGE
jgi:hypothetical protein